MENCGRVVAFVEPCRSKSNDSRLNYLAIALTYAPGGVVCNKGLF